jgi:hypothetical protein
MQADDERGQMRFRRDAVVSLSTVVFVDSSLDNSRQDCLPKPTEWSFADALEFTSPEHAQALDRVRRG